MPEQRQDTVYGLLDSWAGEHFDHSVAARLGNMPPEQLDAFLDYYHDFQSALGLRLTTAGELRPCVPNSFEILRAAHGIGANLLGAVTRLAYMRLLLLYAHSIAVPSELRSFDLAYRHGLFSSDYRPALRNVFLQYADLRELADIGVVEWLEMPIGLEQENAPFELAQLLVEGEDVWSWNELDLGLNRSHGNAIVATTHAVSEICRSLAYADMDVAHLAMRHEFYERIFRLMIARLDFGIGIPEEANIRTLQTLTRLPIPGVLLPTYQEVLQVRQNEDSFFAWRSLLSDSLREIMAMPASADLEAARTLMRERLQPQAHRLNADLKRSSFLSSTIEGTSTFSMSATGSFVSALTVGGSLAAASVTSAVSGGLAVVYRYLRNRAQLRSDKAVLSHYTTFLPPS